MRFKHKEDLLQFIWEHQLFDAKNIETTNGKSVSILNQGFLNTNSGPDFENAKITINNTIHYGSVEIHIDSCDWNKHGHQKDKFYNNVILHVCFSGQTTAKREDGTAIPTVLLSSRIQQDSLNKYQSLMSTKSFVACENNIVQVSDFDKTIWLDRMVVERLEERCKLFEKYKNSNKGNWSQTFHIALVRAFGLPTNSVAFEELGIKLPIELIQSHASSLFQLEALFFGISGLLNESLQDSYYLGLQHEYQFLKKKYGLSEINSQLKFGRMRPMNLPHIKLAQLAALYHAQPDIIVKLLKLPSAKIAHQLLDVQLSDYWSTHYSFKKESKARTKKLSNGFTDLLFINAIVPFVFYYEKEKMGGETDKALDYLDSIPKEANGKINKWAKVGYSAKSALQSQGLLYLYKTYCQPQRCLQCGIGKKILLNQYGED